MDYQKDRLISHLKINNQRVPDDRETPEIPNNISKLSDNYFVPAIQITNSESVRKLLQAHCYRDIEKRYFEFLTSDEYSPEWLKDKTKKVFFDTETYHLPNDDDIKILYSTKSTHYISKQRLGICVSIDDNGDVKFWDENKVLELIDYLLEYDEIITFNGIKFDNIVLSGYIPPGQKNKIQKLYNKSFDLMRFLKFYEDKDHYCNLNYYAERYLGDGKLDGFSSINIPSLLREGTTDEISWVWKYCYWDTKIIFDIYKELSISKVEKQKYFQDELVNLDNAIRASIMGDCYGCYSQINNFETFKSENKEVLNNLKNIVKGIIEQETQKIIEEREIIFRKFILFSEDFNISQLLLIHLQGNSQDLSFNIFKEIIPEFNEMLEKFIDSAKEQDKKIKEYIKNYFRYGHSALVESDKNVAEFFELLKTTEIVSKIFAFYNYGEGDIILGVKNGNEVLVFFDQLSKCTLKDEQINNLCDKATRIFYRYISPGGLKYLQSFDYKNRATKTESLKKTLLDYGIINETLQIGFESFAEELEKHFPRIVSTISSNPEYINLIPNLVICIKEKIKNFNEVFSEDICKDKQFNTEVLNLNTALENARKLYNFYSSIK